MKREGSGTTRCWTIQTNRQLCECRSTRLYQMRLNQFEITPANRTDESHTLSVITKRHSLIECPCLSISLTSITPRLLVGITLPISNEKSRNIRGLKREGSRTTFKLPFRRVVHPRLLYPPFVSVVICVHLAFGRGDCAKIRTKITLFIWTEYVIPKRSLTYSVPGS